MTQGSLKPLLWITALLVASGLALLATRSIGDGIEELKPEVVAVYPHDSRAYTQGLLWWNDRVYESTGKYGRSSLREVELSSGRVLKEHLLPDDYFAEGLALAGNRLIQLTWREKKAFAYDVATFRGLEEFTYATEGWGLCFDGTRLFMSDGSDTLLIREPRRFLLVDQLKVTLEGEPVTKLNELECVGGSIYANVWMSDRIIRIDPANGRVTAVIDASNLHPDRDGSGEDVLNGIAYVPSRQTFLLTGKNWPQMFEVRLVPRS